MAFDDGSLFGDYDVASAADDPFSVADGTYRVTILDFVKREVKPNKDGVEPYAVMDVKTKEKGGGRSLDYTLFLPSRGDSEAQIARKRSTMKAFLAGLEVPEERMNTIRRDDLIGIDAVVTISTSKPKQEGGRTFKNWLWQRDRGTAVGTLSADRPTTQQFQQAAGPNNARDEFGL